MTYAIAAGCSHTAGVGNDIADCYVSYLERHYNFPIINRGIPGGNSSTTLLSVVNDIQASNPPAFIIAQWPNPIRRTAWINGTRQLQNINYCDESFNLLFRNGEETFYEEWTNNVIVSNVLCKLAGISIINITLESIDRCYIDRLKSKQIDLHVDEKRPGLTWHFDSAAQDNVHHSPWCHQQWAQRLIRIIDEHLE